MSIQPPKVEKKKSDGGALALIENLGNKLPHPFILFIWLFAITAVLSAVFSTTGFSAIHPGTKKLIGVKSFFSTEGIQWFITNFLTNFTSFAPLGMVLTMTFGIGLAEETGLIMVALRRMLAKVPKSMLSFSIIMIGFISHLASDASGAIVPPLAGLIFLGAGRNPVAGMLAGLAGASAGFTANLFIQGTDALLTGITMEVTKNFLPGYTMSPLSNWFFMSPSAIILSFIGAWLTDKYVEPKLGPWRIKKSTENVKMEEATPEQLHGLRNAGIASLVFFAIILVGLIPARGILRDPKTFTVVPSPFLTGIVPILMAFFVTVAITYGVSAGRIKSASDIPGMMTRAITTMTGYITVVFASAQFIKLFDWTGMGTVLAIKGADFLKTTGLTGIPLIIGIALLTLVIDLFFSSGSAKWAIMAPIFVPMLSILGYSPAFTQIIYRIGDSAANPLSPINALFPLYLAFANDYMDDFGIGSVIARMIPYSLVFFVFWIIQLAIYMAFNIPIGPDATIFLR